MITIPISKDKLLRLLRMFKKYLNNLEMIYFEESGKYFSDYINNVESAWREKKLRYRPFSISVKDYVESNRDDEDVQNEFWHAALLVGEIRRSIARDDWSALTAPFNELSRCYEKLQPNIEVLLKKKNREIRSAAAKKQYVDLPELKNMILVFFKENGRANNSESLEEFCKKHQESLRIVLIDFRSSKSNSSYDPPKSHNLLTAIKRWKNEDADFSREIDLCLGG